MKRSIKKVAVLGSGVMGSQIACHFANIGVQVLLLDITPKELTEEESKKGLSLDHPMVKNRIVNRAFEQAIKLKPAPLFDKKFASRIQTGNFNDNLAEIAEYDWIIEVVIENLTIKKQLFAEVEKYRKPGTFITSNTSGIPIHMMLEGRSEDFQKYFCGTHFFNPPRYLKLLEIIPTPKTSPEVIDFFMHYGDLFLGKTTVLCKDTPAFIANRIGVFSIMKVADAMLKMNLNVDQVDKLTGPVIGRPKSATFRTSDVVGLDTLIKVANNLYEGLPNDEAKDLFKVPEFVKKLEENKWLGQKTGQGFYKKIKNDQGKSEILTLDINSFEYKPKEKVRFATLEATMPIDNLKERFPVLLKGKDEAGAFYRDVFFALFEYVSNRIPEISDDLYKIDDALCAGFGWDLGPFATWQSLGVANTVKAMEENGFKANTWVNEMLAAGKETFFTSKNGQKYYYNIENKDYSPIPGTDSFIILENYSDAIVWQNDGATLTDIGDGILNLEFHSKMNTLGAEVMQGVNKAIDIAEERFDGLVIANEGANFSAGANLAILFSYAIEQEFEEVELLVRQFQNTIMRVRYSSIPVIVAPHNMTLGGACEMTMHADAAQAHCETYIGLVEVGAGVIPAGCGTKELALKLSDASESGDIELNRLQNIFMNVATAKVATSAQEAKGMYYLRSSDGISLNKNRQITDAKRAALNMIAAGYTQPIPRNDVKVQGKSGIANFMAGIYGLQTGRFASEHDAKIAEKIAHVICGGDLSYPTKVSEQYLLDLEREAFVSLTGERKTLERMQSILQKGKPLRN